LPPSFVADLGAGLDGLVGDADDIEMLVLGSEATGYAMWFCSGGFLFLSHTSRDFTTAAQ
jgi:hypothetical protein